ncbi:MAG: multiheme c-type cytochrome, partial [Thermoplasmata archaeon]
MDTKRNRIFKILLLSAVFVFIVVLMSFATSDLSADSHGTRAPGDYQGPVTCQDCHSDQYSSWITSPHASAWNTLNTSGEKKEWCESCHTTGANDTAHNGFDPATDQ